MKIELPVAVCSRTFSKHEVLRSELLQKFSHVKFNDEGKKLAGSELVQFLRGSRGAIVALEPIDATVLRELSELKVIAKYGVGLDGIDQNALNEHGVSLGWTGGVNRRSVSELALGMMLDLLRKISIHSHRLKAGEWKNLHGHQLSEKTVGIVGCGHIGKDLVRLLQPFGCEILINDLLDLSEFCREHACTPVEKPELFERSDVVTLHVPYTAETHHLIDTGILSEMKSTAVLINTSRGGVVDEEALASALKDRQIFAAALDVFAEEPPGKSPLFESEFFLGTPHNGGSSVEGTLAMGRSAIEHLSKLVGGLEP